MVSYDSRQGHAVLYVFAVVRGRIAFRRAVCSRGLSPGGRRHEQAVELPAGAALLQARSAMPAAVTVVMPVLPVRDVVAVAIPARVVDPVVAVGNAVAVTVPARRPPVL